MAEPDRTEWSDEELVVRVGQKIFIIPAAKLENYRSPVFEKFGQKEADSFFEKYSRQRVDAAYIRALIAADGDFIPDKPSRGGRRSSKAPRKTAPRVTSKARRGGT